MSCDHLYDDLDQALGDEGLDLTPTARLHVEHCERCAAEVLRLQLLEKELQALHADYEPVDELIANVLERAEKQARLELAKADPTSTGPQGRSRPSELSKSAGKPASARERASSSSRSTDAVSSGGSRRRANILLLLPLAAAATLLLLLHWADTSRNSGPPPTRKTTSPPHEGLTLQVAGLDAGGTMSFKRDSHWYPTQKRASIRLPAMLRTGPAGTVSIVLPDGSQLTLGPNTNLSIVDRKRITLSSGKLLAVVRPRAAADRLQIQVPTGQVEVVGTKFSLSADRDLAVVDVVHGKVRLIDPKGQSVAVDAGQEGMLSARTEPRAVMAPDLGRELAWADHREGQRSIEPEASGLGELLAKRPGRSKARKLRLAEHRVSVRIQGDIARTEIRETFANDSRHTLEGIYRFPLPAQARISRLALYVDGRLEEGTIVERDRARKIWRGVIRQATPKRLRKQEEYVWVAGPWKDPALLEWQRGNRFELRIFPIPKRGSRTIVLAYTETLSRTPRGRRYVYPLAHGGDKVGKFDLSIRLAGHDPKGPIKTSNYALARQRAGDVERLSFSTLDFSPSGDLAVDFATNGSPLSARSWTYQGPESPLGRGRSGPGSEAGYALLSLRPELPALDRLARRRKIVLLVDRSYSHLGEASRRQLMLVENLVGELSPKDEVAILACDTRCAQVSEFQTPSQLQNTGRLLALQRIDAGGATNLGQAIARAGKLVGTAGDATPHVIYVGDGTATIGELEQGRLLAIVKREIVSRGARLTTIGVGSAVDSALLEALARAGGSRYVAFYPGSTARGQALTALASLSASALDEASIDLPPGLFQVAPARVPVIFRGEELRLTARLRGHVKGEIVLRGRVDGRAFSQRFKIDLQPTPHLGNSYLPRVWAQARITDLAGDEAGAQRTQIIALSKRHHLLSRYTSLLVLESEAMRRAFRVERARAVHGWGGKSAPLADATDGASTAHGKFGKGAGLGKAGPIVGDEPDASRSDEKTRTRGTRSGRRRARRSSAAGTGATSAGADRLADLLAGEGTKKDRVGTANGDKTPSTKSARRPSGRGVMASPPGRTRVMGALSRDQIRRTIMQHRHQIETLFWRRLQSGTNVLGSRLLLRFTIGPSGSVTSARVAGTAPRVARQLEQLIRRWRFAAPAGGGSVSVSYPIVFRTANGGIVPQRRRWIRHKRVWEQRAQIGRYVGIGARELRRIARRRQELAENPLSRDRTRKLYQALSRAGRSRAALAVVKSWLSKEPRSKEALRRYAEALARIGQPRQAERALGSLLELDPTNVRLQRRLERMARGANDGELACALRSSLAALTRTAKTVSQAESCRQGVLPPALENVWGRIRLDARWHGAVDLDLALVDRLGRRYSWNSASSRVFAASTRDLQRERLALSWLAPGTYRIEVRPADGSVVRHGIRGRIAIHGPKLRDTLRFSLRAGRSYVGSLTIKRESRLVPAP